MTPLRQSRKEPVDVTLKFTLHSFHFESTRKFKLFRPWVASSLEKSRGHKMGPCGTPSQLIRANEKTSQASFNSQLVDSVSTSKSHEVLGCFHSTSKTTARIWLNAAVNAHLQRRERLQLILTPPNLSCKEAPIRSSQLWNATSTGSIPGCVHLASPPAYWENRLHLYTANNSKQQQQQQPWEHGVRGGLCSSLACGRNRWRGQQRSRWEARMSMGCQRLARLRWWVSPW